MVRQRLHGVLLSRTIAVGGYGCRQGDIVGGFVDRGELSQALLLLSDWYGDPSLSPGEEAELDTLLSQLAGSVIYSTEHRLEPPYRVQAGQRLQDIAQQYNVPYIPEVILLNAAMKKLHTKDT